MAAGDNNFQSTDKGDETNCNWFGNTIDYIKSHIKRETSVINNSYSLWFNY